MRAQAAGPLFVNGAGTPLVWTANPVPFNPDQGTLGARTNAQAVADVTGNFAVWTGVATSTVSFANAGAMPIDVTVNNYNAFLGACGDGLSPIVFDSNGTITDDTFGTGASNSILGFASPDCGTFVPPVITEGFAVLNGKWIDGINNGSNPELPLATFNAVFVHEFGHYINLDHSQINLVEAFDGNPANDDAIATMFPFLVNGSAIASLNLDDQVSVSMLYPAPSFATSFGTITGSILTPGGARFQGAHVVARQVGNPRINAVGNASGARYFPRNPGGPPAAALEGFYELRGLPPGNYTVEVEAIDPDFTGGSVVGPLDPPAVLPGPSEFWNAGNESNTNPPDNPATSVPITVSSGATLSGVDIRLNGAGSPPTPPPGSTATPTPLVTPSPRRTVAAGVKCARAITKSAATFTKRNLVALAACTGGIFRCVETMPGDQECLPKAARRCETARAQTAAAAQKLTTAILRRCNEDSLPFASVLDAAGLGYAAVGGTCQSDFAVTVGDAAAVATCIGRQHECEAGTLFSAALPRAGELLRVAGVSADSWPCVRDFTGLGEGVPDARRTGKKIDRCTRAIVKSGSTFVNKGLKNLAHCLDTVFACLQPPTVDLAGCVVRATDTCDGAFAKNATNTAKLVSGIVDKCSDEVVLYATLRAQNAANFDALSTECAAHGIASLDTVDDYASCLSRQHQCRMAELLRFEAPRAEEMLELVHRELRASFCPVP